MNDHPYTKEVKERCGWGKWHTVIVRLCKVTGKEFRIVKNWHGPRPRGGIYCPHCNQVIDL